MQSLLIKNSVVLFDDTDCSMIVEHTWHLVRASCNWYVATWIRENGERRKIYMHRLIMNVTNAMEVHHKNGDTLDNRRENLEVCTRQGNLSYREWGEVE